MKERENGEKSHSKLLYLVLLDVFCCVTKIVCTNLMMCKLVSIL